jgi:hypothetical protein
VIDWSLVKSVVGNERRTDSKEGTSRREDQGKAVLKTVRYGYMQNRDTC